MPKPPIASLTRARTVATTRLRSRNCSLAEIPRLLQLTAKNRGWAIVGVLKLVDLSLTANLLLIVICSSYENFVARIDPADHTHWPEGLIGIGFSGLKQKLLGSIVAIAAVNVLEWFLDIDRSVDNIKLGWVVGILLRSPVSSSATVAGAGQVSFAVNCKFSQFCPLSETSVAPPVPHCCQCTPQRRCIQLRPWTSYIRNRRVLCPQSRHRQLSCRLFRPVPKYGSL